MQNYNSLVGISPEIRAVLADVGFSGGLPPIRGQWFIVDPYKASESSVAADGALADLETAYDACVSGRGDGILVLSGGTGTASQTTSYLKQSLAWSKHGITVVGVSSGTQLYGRARVANVEVTTGSISTLAFVQGASPVKDKATDSAGGFLTAGFEAGQYVTINTTGNGADGTGFVIDSVTADTMTFTSSDTLVTETAANAGASTIKSYNPEMIVVSGSNNAFYNIHVGNFSSDAGALGSLKVSGNRNAFYGCHFIGAGHATPGAVAGAYDLEINGGQENTFHGCAFGTDTIIRAATNGNIRFDTNAWRSRFYDCEILSYSATSTKGAILSADATALEGVHVFSRCRFINWNENALDMLASAFIGTAPTSGRFLMDSCSLFGYTAWDSVGGNDTLYVANSAAVASGAGGIATTV